MDARCHRGRFVRSRLGISAASGMLLDDSQRRDGLLREGKSVGRQAGAVKFRLKCCRWRLSAVQEGRIVERDRARFGALKIVREFLLIWSTPSSATKQITRTRKAETVFWTCSCSLTGPWDVLPRLGKEPLSSKVEAGISAVKITDETNGICKYRVCASRNAPPWTSPARHVESSGGYPSVLAPTTWIEGEQAASNGPAPETTVRKDARRAQNSPKAYCAGRAWARQQDAEQRQHASPKVA
jgi:hypothetical protein